MLRTLLGQGWEPHAWGVAAFLGVAWAHLFTGLGLDTTQHLQSDLVARGDVVPAESLADALAVRLDVRPVVLPGLLEGSTAELLRDGETLETELRTHLLPHRREQTQRPHLPVVRGVAVVRPGIGVTASAVRRTP